MTHEMVNSLASMEQWEQEASSRVLRRAQIARVTRQLKSRLAFANYKASRGWSQLPLDSVEPRLEKEALEKVESNPALPHSHKRLRTSPPVPRETMSSPGPEYRRDRRKRADEENEPRTSPPHTPPRHIRTGQRRSRAGDEGADLLLYLATSPSPAAHARPARPSTPPSNNPKPHNTVATPSRQFDFADFVNITPSPVGVAPRRREAAHSRRRLTFSNPMDDHHRSTRPIMEQFGGDLMPSR